jgi:hypothetical protein
VYLSPGTSWFWLPLRGNGYGNYGSGRAKRRLAASGGGLPTSHHPPGATKPTAYRYSNVATHVPAADLGDGG